MLTNARHARAILHVVSTVCPWCLPIVERACDHLVGDDWRVSIGGYPLLDLVVMGHRRRVRCAWASPSGDVAAAVGIWVLPSAAIGWFMDRGCCFVDAEERIVRLATDRRAAAHHLAFDDVLCPDLKHLVCQYSGHAASVVSGRCGLRNLDLEGCDAFDRSRDGHAHPRRPVFARRN